MQDAKNRQKIAIWAPCHHPTNLSGYIFATKARIDNRKNLLSSNMSSTCPHNMANFGPLAAEIVSLVRGTPANFNGFRVCFVTAATSLNGSQPNFAQCLTLTWAGRLCIHFRYCFSVTEFCPVQNSLCALLLAALLHSSRAVGANQTLRR